MVISSLENASSKTYVMCGIFLTAGKQSLSIDNIDESLAVMYRRGPDAQVSWQSDSKSAWLGHCRLSINDLSEAGNQPFHYGHLSLICNGEIYNYPELKEELESLGHTFSSHSDCEAILYAYTEWGENCVDKLRGMFAFCIWDDQRQQLFAARDRVGIKPFYFHHDAHNFSMASDSRALLKLPFVKKAVNKQAIAYVMTLGYVPSPHSIWQDIHKLEAGHSLTWSEDDGLKTHRYWKGPTARDEKLSSKQWHATFMDSVEHHLLSDVPVSMFLSGGLDSTSIAVALHQLGKKDIEAYTISYPRNSEAHLAKSTADKLNIPHHVKQLQTQDIWALLEDYGKAYDEPQGYSALLSMLDVCAQVDPEKRVVLSGDGGDELHAGYTWYKNLKPTLLQKIKAYIRFVLHGGNNWERFALKSPLHRHASRLFPRFLPEEVDSILKESSFTEEDMLQPLRKHNHINKKIKKSMQYIDLMTFCSDSICAKVDKASMYRSLEVRVPYLDNETIQATFSHTVKKEKGLIKKFIQPFVSREVTTHPKQGFSLRGLDQFDWDTAVSYIKKSQFFMDYFEKDALSTIEKKDTFKHGRIWTILMLCVWAENNLYKG